MLDQNTDRMWYVIGAVIIGAAIIFILNGMIPELFASVGGTFQDKTKETTDIVDGIKPNTRPKDDIHLIQDLLREQDIQVTHATTINTSEFNSSGTVHMVLGDDPYAGIRFLARDLSLKPSTNYVFQYDYQKTGGTLVSFGGHIHDIFKDNRVVVNGVERDIDYMDENSVYVDDSDDIQHVEVHFTTPDTIDVSLDGSYWENVHDTIAIQPNRKSEVPVDVSVYHLTLVEEVN